MNSPLLKRGAGAALGAVMGDNGGGAGADGAGFSAGDSLANPALGGVKDASFGGHPSDPGLGGGTVPATQGFGGEITVTGDMPGTNPGFNQGEGSEGGDVIGGNPGGGGGGDGAPGGGGLPPWIMEALGMAGQGNPYVSGAMTGVDMIQGANQDVVNKNQQDFERRRQMALQSPQYLEWANSFWGG